jgi:hypothetical protein
MSNTVQPCDSENGNICVHCSLCCDGSMFGYTVVNKNDDLRFLKQMGFEFVKEHDKLLFYQPCMGLKDKLCTLYDDERRFGACKKFVCRLLRQYNSGKISYNSAMDVIREVMMHRQRIKEFYEILHIGDDGSEQSIYSFIKELELSGKTDDLSFRRKYSKQIMDCLMFGELLERGFYNKKGEVLEYTD